MEWNRIQSLYERYLSGDTSLDEQRELYTLLSEAKELHKEYHAIKVMLEAMGTIALDKCNIDIKHTTLQPNIGRSLSLRRIASIAAIITLIVGATIASLVSTTTPRVEEPKIVCHINGTIIQDQLVAQTEVHRILDGVSRNMNTAKQRIDNITKLTSNK